MSKTIFEEKILSAEKDRVFSRALIFTLREEGGFVHHPTDPGGPTNMGVTQEVYDQWRQAAGLPAQDVRAISRLEAVEIYRERYWRDGLCSEIAALGLEDLALAHFDACVHSGVRRAAQLLQRAARVRDDGIIGPITLDAVYRADPAALLRDCIEERQDFLVYLVTNRPSTYLPFLRGWLARLRRLRLKVGVSYAE